MTTMIEKITADGALTSIRNTHFACRVSFGMPQQTKKDKKAQADAETINNAHGALAVRRRLYAKHTLDPFTSIAAAGRAFLRTRCTDMGGTLLLAKENMFEVIDTIENRYFVEWDQQKSVFGQSYSRVLQEAQQTQGFLFDPTVYPDVSTVVAQFTRSFDIHPVGNIAGGLFDDLEASLAADVAARVEATTMREIKAALADPMARLVEVVMHVHNKTTRDNSRIHDSLMTELEELTGLIPSLNIVNLPMLNDMAAQVRQELLVPVEAVKDKDSSTREQVATKSAALLQGMGVNPDHNSRINTVGDRKAAAEAAAHDILSQMKGLF